MKAYKKLSPKTGKIVCAIFLVVGLGLTWASMQKEFQKYYLLHMIVFFLAMTVDIVFLRLLYVILKRKALPFLAEKAKKAFSLVFRHIFRFADKITEKYRPKDKIFIAGENEHSFAIEINTNKVAKSRKKLPKLAKDASERERIRYEYTCFVFKRDKNISSVLTPNEVALRLDENGENRVIFENYNEARYSEENS
ncbi:MAG: hypothetical protein IJ489_10640 [Clostridia bacterium]|nr:hypothetical protein [Clostridia bacterium]